MPLATAPSTYAGIVTAIGTLLTALALVITALGAAMVNRRTSKRIDENQQATTARLAVIHTLVNSTLTAAKDAELAATRRELTMMLELAAAHREAGKPDSDDRMAAIGALRRRVDELTSVQADRADQTRVADMQIAIEAERQAAERRG